MIKLLTMVVCASFLMAGASFAADDTKKPCCEKPKDIAAQKDCACDCCKKAAEKGKWCKKCHPQPKKAATPAK